MERTIPKHHRGIQGYTPTGGKIIISDIGGGGADKLSQEEFNAYEKARLIIDPRNGGDWLRAIDELEKAGFEIFWR